MRWWPRRDPLLLAQNRLAERLSEHLGELDRRARVPALRALCAQLIAQNGLQPPADAPLVAALVAAADAAFGAVLRLETKAAQMTVAYQSSTTERAQRDVLIRHLRETVAPGEVRRDVAALDRWLDLEALKERISIRIADRIDEIEVAYTLAGRVALELPAGPERLAALGGGLVFTTAFKHAISGRREAVRCAALRFMTCLLSGFPASERIRCLGANRFMQVRDWASTPTTARWLRVDSLALTVMASLPMAVDVLKQLLAERGDDPVQMRDGMIVRRNGLRLVGEHRLAPERALPLVLPSAEDPSEHVRQELCTLLAGLPGEAALARLCEVAKRDESVRVRGVAARSLCTRALAHSADAPIVADVIEEAIGHARTATEVAVALESVSRLCSGASAPCRKSRFVAAVVDMMRRAETPPAAAEQAAALLRRLEVESAPALLQVSQRLRGVLEALPEGKQQRVDLPATLRLRDVEFALATAARGDLTVGIRALGRGRYLVRRGERRTFKLWRLLHELASPAPDKRKAFAHTHGRTTGSGSVVPTHLLAEVTPTRVPGERRLRPSVGGWAPFLPRVDDLLEASRPFASPLRIVTSVGVVTVVGARSLLGRLRAWVTLTLRYAHYDRLRDRSLSATQEAQKSRYVEICRALGFRVSLGDTVGVIEDERYDSSLPRVAPYLQGLWLPDLRHHWDGLLQYTVSPSGNTPFHLATLVWIMLTGFIARAAWIMGQIERARGAIPLSIGGWGTRGKSGTERLKAALFHALRLDVVVKTTGCEAMFIHARRDLPAREIFIYRPYDKATIWEQRRVLEFGARLGAQVFLWECMALNPRFVQVLNRDWMQDPVTTLTNAYPDHEDVMGPSGEDVARVIGIFMPKGGTTYTAEEQMLPILRELANRSGTDLRSVGPLEADLLPKDLLDRYPYDEHPRNIALVCALAEHYGIDKEFAIVEMGDRVVPDLGVLKTYPKVPYRGRTLEFSNGMSANERAGFLSNWTRLEFDRMDPDADPTVVSVAVVNNRADRVPRSRVFAEILTRDVSLGAIVLVGTNLDGMGQFLQEALNAQLSDVDFSGTSIDQATETLDRWLAKMGCPCKPETVVTQLRAMIRAALAADVVDSVLAEPDIDKALCCLDAKLPELLEQRVAPDMALQDGIERGEFLDHIRRCLVRTETAAAARKRVAELLSTGQQDDAAGALRAAVSELFAARVFTLWDAGAKGDQVVHFAAGAVPPGHHARLLGCQNIKGTGLDFVYRFLSLGNVTDLLTGIEQVPDQRSEGLANLTTYKDFGILDAQVALTRVHAWLASDDEAWQRHLPLLEAARDHLIALCDQKRKALSAATKQGIFERFLNRGIEPLLDHWDSTRRTQQAGRVMEDLFSVRVGQGRAALLLRDVVARQKGGWLAKSLMRRGKS